MSGFENLTHADCVALAALFAELEITEARTDAIRKQIDQFRTSLGQECPLTDSPSELAEPPKPRPRRKSGEIARLIKGAIRSTGTEGATMIHVSRTTGLRYSHVSAWLKLHAEKYGIYRSGRQFHLGRRKR